ncbi:MAG: peptidase S24 [Candidatus Aminicenantes bacterium]|nr:peptidase S24 [Candidatus Aminicenantes bacterium]
MYKELHPIQKKLLDILKNNIEDPLTIREIQGMLDASSTSVVAYHIAQLEKRGFLKKNPLNPKDYHILKDGPEKQIVYLNLYGLAHCGARGSILEGDPIDRIPLSARLISFPASEAFMVKAKGDSMEPLIHEGDLIIARKCNSAENGRIVVCINNGEALIKKIKRESKNTILISENSKHPPFLASKKFRIEGEVRGIITSRVV